MVPDGRDYRVEGNDVSGYIGVSPEYMTYANETEKPTLTPQEEWDYTHNLDDLEGNADDEGEVSSTDSGGTEVKESEQSKAPVTPVVTTPVVTSPVITQ